MACAAGQARPRRCCPRRGELARALRCDVLVVGGGITGALIADELARHGHDVAVVEQRDIGWGSSAASTALLQYEIDTHMVDLATRYGEDAAVLAYRACADAIGQLQALSAELRGVDFRRGESLYYASRHRHQWRQEIRQRRFNDAVAHHQPDIETPIDEDEARRSRQRA